MRTTYCGTITEKHIHQQVKLCGWVERCRNLGGVIFIDLRDREGVVQVFVDPQHEELMTLAAKLRAEFCVQVTGLVRARPQQQINTHMSTGHVEVVAQSLEIINQSPPLPLDPNQNNTEEQRLRYRYLDLRRPEMSQIFKLRAQTTRLIRAYLDEHGFLDIETPVLTKATPEGARDYLVPSRVHKGSFYALPQSPQLFKQLLMMSGMDRYYQIVKCFRDEDLRSDRQPEFTQVDIETSFVSSQDIRHSIEALLTKLWKNTLDIDLGHFPVLSYDEAIRRFGCDKPDLRIDLEFFHLDAHLKSCGLSIFEASANNPQHHVVALCLPQGAALSRKQIDHYSEYVSTYGASGLAWMKVKDAQALDVQSPIAKFLTPETLEQIIQHTRASSDSLLFFCAGEQDTVNAAMAALRLKLGHDHGRVAEGFKPLWVIDFPMFENLEERWSAMHHPFTAPSNCTLEQLHKNPGEIYADAYDVVINGYEVGGGSVRIHHRDMQQAVFELLGLGEQEQHEKFGFLLEALKYGAPPHAGIALGLDRIVMLLAQTDNIRDVIAFPKTTAAACLLTQAPSSISTQQLDELAIQLNV